MAKLLTHLHSPACEALPTPRAPAMLLAQACDWSQAHDAEQKLVDAAERIGVGLLVREVGRGLELEFWPTPPGHRTVSRPEE